MPRRVRIRPSAMQSIRQWREALGLTRQMVADAIAEKFPEKEPKTTQATLAKWEDGTSALTVETLNILAEIYQVPAQALLSPPQDPRHRDWYVRLVQIVEGRDSDAVEQWITLGERLPAKTAKDDEDEDPPALRLA